MGTFVAPCDVHEINKKPGNQETAGVPEQALSSGAATMTDILVVNFVAVKVPLGILVKLWRKICFL